MNLLRRNWNLIAALIVGLLLRLWQIDLQVVGNDEYHGLYQVFTRSYTWIATHFGEADHSIPLTLLYRLAIDYLWLSEWVMRLPTLVAGTLAIVAFPLLVRDWIAPSARNVFTWLLAISPLLIFYSRLARPYAISTLAGFVAVLAFYRWFETRETSARRLFVLCAVLACWFHLSLAPFVLAPFVFSAVALASGRSRLSLTDLLMCGSMVALGLALLLGPPLIADASTVADKIGTDGFDLSNVLVIAQLFTGTGEPWFIAITLTFGLVGGISLFKRERLFALFLLTCVISSALFLILSAPALGNSPGLHAAILARYSLCSYVVLLLCVSIGLTSLIPAERVGSFSAVTAIAASYVALALWLGPLKSTYYFPNNLTNHGIFQMRYDQSEPWCGARPERISDFYKALSALPPGETLLVEAPWYYEWGNNFLACLQKLHRQKIAIGFVDDPDGWSRIGEIPLNNSGVSFRNFVHVGDAFQLNRIGATFLVFHPNLDLELGRQTRKDHVDVSQWIKRSRLRYGDPIFEDDDIVVFRIGDPVPVPPRIALRRRLDSPHRIDGHLDEIDLGPLTRIAGWGRFDGTRLGRRLLLVSNFEIAEVQFHPKRRPDVVIAEGDQKLLWSGFEIEIRAGYPVPSNWSKRFVCVVIEDSEYGRHLTLGTEVATECLRFARTD